MPKRSRVILIVAAAILGISLVPLFPRIARFAEISRDYGFASAMDETARRFLPGRGRLVEWPTATPHEAGLVTDVLDSLRDTLAVQSTTAFLVARRGGLAYEWYAGGHSAAHREPLAAVAKAVVGTMALLTLAEDGQVRLDERAAVYIPRWRDDARKSQITLQQLANYASGLDDVDFPPSGRGDDFFAGEPAWKQEYFEHPDRRFAMALELLPLVSDPGTEYRYSGSGYYVLAYAVSAAIHEHSGEDLRHWLARRVYLPLGIPADAWELSYGESYPLDGLTLYAMGSGASFTARAVARVGQFVLDHWNEPSFRPLHSPILGGAAPDSAATVSSVFPRVPHYGWWGNEHGAWPSLPSDALVGLGAGDNVVLIVPSLQLVAVRLGGALSGSAGPDARLDQRLFAPLMRALQKVPR